MSWPLIGTRASIATMMLIVRFMLRCKCTLFTDTKMSSFQRNFHYLLRWESYAARDENVLKMKTFPFQFYAVWCFCQFIFSCYTKYTYSQVTTTFCSTRLMRRERVWSISNPRWAQWSLRSQIAKIIEPILVYDFEYIRPLISHPLGLNNQSVVKQAFSQSTCQSVCLSYGQSRNQPASRSFVMSMNNNYSGDTV